MEKGMEFEQKNLISIELTQGKEVANQLKTHLESKKKSGETCEVLVEKILSSYEKALSMLKSRALILEEQLPVTSSMLESPHSIFSDSPSSEISDQSHKNVFKKRKALAQWSKHVQVSLGTGVDGPLGDGYSWRKYGQKDILGASFPRAYYRCTHRHAQGCLATKQVQKSGDNPSLLEVTYRGRHTCHQVALVSLGKRKEEENYQPENENENKIPKQTEEKIIDFGEGLKAEKLERLPSFSFPSNNPIESENDEENHFFAVDLGGNNSPPFITGETSESSNYFSLSPCSPLNNFEFAQYLRSSESDLTEILSAPNSVTNSPIGGFGISLDQVDFDPNFPLDVLEFFQ